MKQSSVDELVIDKHPMTSPKRRASAEQWQKWCQEIASDLQYLERYGLDLLSRAKYGIKDGYPTNSRHEGGSSPIGTHSDPVGTIAITKDKSDPIRSAAFDVTELMSEVKTKILQAANVTHSVLDNPETPEHDNGLATCQCCKRDVMRTRSDQYRSGYCNACYQAYRKYLREGGTDRVQFENQRRQYLEQLEKQTA